MKIDVDDLTGMLKFVHNNHDLIERVCVNHEAS